MKTIFPLVFCIVVLNTVSVLDAGSQDKLNQTLTSIKEKVKDIQIEKTTYKQSISILEESKGKLAFVSEVVDDKGKTSKERFEFYLSDIDKNTILRKTSGKKLFVSLSINNNQKFIQHFRDDKLDGYINNLEILLSGTDSAEELASLIKGAIPLVNSSEKGWNTNKDALNWLKSNITKVNTGSAAFEQSFSFGESKEYLSVYDLKKTDQKGLSTEEKYEFNILDINSKNLIVKVTGTQLSVTVETKEKNPYIRYTKNNEQQSFANDFEVIAESIEQARNIISAFTVAIEKSKTVMPDFGSLQKSLDFISKNTIDLTSEKKTVNQKIVFTPGNGTNSLFSYTEPDSKGKPVEERYEFYLNDIDATSLSFKVSGKKISVVCISKNKTKFIRYFKDNILQDFQNEVVIVTSDIETSREMAEAFRAAIKDSEIPPTSWKNTGEAIGYLTSTLKGETIGTDLYKLNFSSVTTDPLNVRYVQAKTDSKGITVEQSFEFYPYMLDAASLKIGSSGKYLSVEVSVSDKKSFIKVLKEGRQQPFENSMAIMAFDARQSHEIAEAIRYLAGNSKPKEQVWGDKQSAVKFITENVTDLKIEGKEIKQKTELTNNDPCRISYTVSTSDDKGKTADEIYEFSLTDINKQMVDFKVSGKNVEVTLTCKNKTKLVKVYKNGEQQAWGTDVKFRANDIETARNIADAFKSIITQCEK